MTLWYGQHKLRLVVKIAIVKGHFDPDNRKFQLIMGVSKW